MLPTRTGCCCATVDHHKFFSLVFCSFSEWLHLPPADRLMMIPSIILGAATIRRCIMDLEKEGSSWGAGNGRSSYIKMALSMQLEFYIIIILTPLSADLVINVQHLSY